MKALVYHGPRDIRCENIADPGLAEARGAIVRVSAASICGSDLHLYHGRLPIEPGFAVGHEFVGVVEEVGREVRRFRRGDRVIVPGVASCGECANCRRGYSVGCLTAPMPVFGMSSRLPGGQAELVRVPVADANLVPIPADLPDERVLFLTDILPTGYYGARNGDIRPGDVVAVVGAGPVGLSAMMAAKLFGPARLIAIDRVPARLEAARRLGAQSVDASTTDPVGAVHEVTDGLGADVVIEAVGAEETLLLAVQLVRMGGHVSVVGVFVEPSMPFPVGLLFLKDVRLHMGTCNVAEYVPPLLNLVRSGAIDPTALISHHLPLGDGARAYDMFDRRADNCVKIVLTP